jgi:hypothetical protein
MTMTGQSRREVIASRVEEHNDDSQAARVPVRFEGEDRNLPVIRLPLESVVLNPKNHRIKAQLESHPDARLVMDDPFSDEGQRVIAEVIRTLEGFEELKQNLDEDDQREHGIITHVGLLVNANRRTVALRELGQEYIRVAVLPPTTSLREIMQLELSLQMQVDFREDYTYTNNLLFVDELISDWNRSRNDVALMLGWAASSQDSEIRKGVERVAQATRILGLIRRTQQMAPDRIPITFFDEKVSHLQQADSDYEKLRDSDLAGAERVLQGQLMSTLAGANYRDLRLYDEYFLQDYLLRRFEESDTLRHLMPYLTANGDDLSNSPSLDGLDVLGMAQVEDADDGSDPARLFQLIAETWTDSEEATVPLTVENELVPVPVLQIHEELATAIGQAAEEATADRRYDRGLDAPLEHMRLASHHMRRANETFLRVQSNPDFNIGNLQYRIRKHLQSVEEFRDRVTDSRE